MLAAWPTHRSGIKFYQECAEKVDFFCLFSVSQHKIGGFDNQVYLWDMKSLTALSIENSTVTCSNLAGAQNSLYSIDTNNAGTVVAAGGTEKHIRVRVAIF